MENVDLKINGNEPEWTQACWQNAENKKPFVLINFTLEMMPECHAIAKKHGYELKGRIPPKGLGFCHFIPRNYAAIEMAIPFDFIFSGHPEDPPRNVP